jgi:hypothetical protein
MVEGFLVGASIPAAVYRLAGHVSRSSGLLRVEVSLARVSQSGLKTGGGTTTGGARGTIVEVASEAS